MQMTWNRAQRAEVVKPAGLAGWVLALIQGREVGKTPRHMRVVEHLALGGRRQLTLVACDGERYLVGGSAEGVETIVRVGPEKRTEAPCL